MKKLRTIGCLLLLTVSLAHANTRFGFGTIMDVDLTGENDPKKTPTFVGRKVCSRPRRFAAAFNASSAGPMRGLVVEPSMRRAIS